MERQEHEVRSYFLSEAKTLSTVASEASTERKGGTQLLFAQLYQSCPAQTMIYERLSEAKELHKGEARAYFKWCSASEGLISAS